MTKRDPAPPPTFAQLEEAVRERLVTSGQHGTLGEFQKYTAAVREQFAVRPITAEQLEQIKASSDALDGRTVAEALARKTTIAELYEGANAASKPKRTQKAASK